MKTAIQELIDILQSNEHEFIPRLETINLLDKVGKEQERKQIIEAHSEGMKTVDCQPEYSEQYYNDKFVECECVYEYNDDHHPLLVYQCYLCEQKEIESDDFQPCGDCDGHDACSDFGCAIKLGLGHLVKPPL